MTEDDEKWVEELFAQWPEKETTSQPDEADKKPNEKPKTHDFPPTPQPEAAPMRKKWVKYRFDDIRTFKYVMMRHLTRVEQSVWLCIWDDTDAKTGLAEVSIGEMATFIGCSERAVSYAISSLKNKGLLKVVRNGNFAKRTPNTYRLIMNKDLEEK